MSRRSTKHSDRPLAAGTEPDQIGRHLIEAYVQLAVTPPGPDGSRTVVIERLGGVTVHLTELPRQHIPSTMPHLWLEIFSSVSGSPMDSYGCFDLGEDELMAATQLIVEARQAA